MVLSFSLGLSDSVLSMGADAGASDGTAGRSGFQPRRRRAFVTTHTELRLMAAAAIMGLRFRPMNDSAPAATGMHTALYTSAQNRFCLMLRSVARESWMETGTSKRSLRMSTMSALSMATSVPAPMAMPTSARASAGASLMPSPTMATRPSPARRRISRSLPSGSTPAMTSSAPTSRWMAAAVRSLSPVSITVRMPMSFSTARAAALEGFTVSATATMPRSSPSWEKNNGVLPSSASCLAASGNAPVSMPRASIMRRLPASEGWSSTSAATPSPGICLKSSTRSGYTFRSRA